MSNLGNIKIKTELPVIALKNVTLFPKIAIPLVVQRSISRTSLEAARDGMVLFISQKHTNDKITPDDLFKIGTVGRIISSTQLADGSTQIEVEGLARVHIRNFSQLDPYIRAKISLAQISIKDTTKNVTLMKKVIDNFKKMSEFKLVPAAVSELLRMASSLSRDPEQVIGFIAINLNLSLEEQQELLETFDVNKALEILNTHLESELDILDAEQKVAKETKKQIGKMQKEVYLREQLKSIEKELGMDGEKNEFEELRIKITEAKMPKAVDAKAMKELDRLERMPAFSPEISYIRTYLDWLIEMPWSKKSKTSIDLKKAKAVLDEDHFGLEKVKERILEFLAVQKSVGKIKGPILCFVGPPGTGKTSIAQSIARATGRKTVRVSLGGIRDEAEVRGHRRTYVGALPGRVIQSIHSAEINNPVFILDEIDKVGVDFRGDPTAALLEALDPQQNHSFSDHYLEVPFDLSDVMFITTANTLETIPDALRDRLEIIDFSGYIEEEKVRIAKDFIIPRVLKDHGLKPTQVIFIKEAVATLIRDYTREAGVRDLERQFSKIARKICRQMVEFPKKYKKVSITSKDLTKYLGATIFSYQTKNKKDEIGIVSALSWTPAGGEILPIEATSMPGKGKLVVTGRLGNVMKESVHAALSYARSKAKLESEDFYGRDLHINVPSASMRKDGPSAGITMATALVSLFTGRAVRRDVGMTGEITLRGEVAEIGGVKEKVIAAYRAGLKTIILPQQNKKDLNDIPKEVRRKLKFAFVKNIDQALKIALK